MHHKIFTSDGIKRFRSEDYNYDFSSSDGFFARWGKTTEDDPKWSPFGPEIMDIEISDGESCPMTCVFCSPAGTLINTPDGKVEIEKITEGDLIIGFDVENNAPKIQEVEETYSREYKGELVCIETEDGQILKLTPEHEVYTRNRGWIMSKELTNSDEIVSF